MRYLAPIGHRTQVTGIQIYLSKLRFQRRHCQDTASSPPLHKKELWFAVDGRPGNNFYASPFSIHSWDAEEKAEKERKKERRMRKKGCILEIAIFLTHTHTHASIQPLTHTHAFTNTHWHSHTRTHAPTHVHAHTHTRTHAHTHAYINALQNEGGLKSSC